ncbi:MAG: serine protein kinase PrkA [Myxococcales bacterium]|nr:serine protein kinase PrkA [Myxococcales bacterium]
MRLEALASAAAREFESTRRVLTFDEWFAMFCEAPRLHARGAAEYLRDAFEHYGRRDVHIPSGKVSRFRLFDCEFARDRCFRLVGQEPAQNAFYEALESFVRIGRVNKLLLLHGPNGSAKTTFIDAVARALADYSHKEEGALYRFSWVFPTKIAVQGHGIGFDARSILAEEAPGEGSFARLEADMIDTKIADEHKDHPIFLIPSSERAALLESLQAADDRLSFCDAIHHGELTHRNRKIFDALLATYQGDLRRVYRHVQVERFYLSRTYRTGLVTVEPKQTVDARSYPVTGDRAYASLPPHVGGQVLYAMQGDLVDANRGLINFSDLLKRPYEHFKYLLTATESGAVALDHVVLGLDLVFTGSANDLNLLEFRALRSGEYQSLRARLELIPVPYLLDYRVERKIYQEQVSDLLRGIHIAPHVARTLALWGVMTRLRPANPALHGKKLEPVLRRLSPYQKAGLYAYGRVPPGLSSEQARELLAAVPALGQERFPQTIVRAEGSDHVLGDYEGSFGASVRDLKRVLLAAASDPGADCLTVPRLFRELRRFLQDVASHRWMAIPPTETGFHKLDGEGSITEAAWNHWLDLSDREVREAMGLIDEARYLDLFKKYVVHVSHHLKGERLYDPLTGKSTEPDQKFMKDLERTMDPNAGATFRADVLSRIGAWALANPEEEPAYAEIFSDYFTRLREDYYRQQKDTVGRGIARMLELLSPKKGRGADLSQAEEERARAALEVLLGEREGGVSRRDRHSPETLRETLVELARARY